ncbi:hypothetical protein ACFFX0_28645 [Citricoccus parietis]|uniref:Uncharacterized protein n=1 Tax=Citricoccus parietis TaxID=592307 RepID=A0ABV5G7K7_9MICC
MSICPPRVFPKGSGALRFIPWAPRSSRAPIPGPSGRGTASGWKDHCGS